LESNCSPFLFGTFCCFFFFSFLQPVEKFVQLLGFASLGVVKASDQFANIPVVTLVKFNPFPKSLDIFACEASQVVCETFFTEITTDECSRSIFAREEVVTTARPIMIFT
jgi:hypothetical protein